MTNDVRIFGMHKAGTSFLMKALSHFCHRNKVALASSPFGMLPLQAYGKWVDGISRAELDKFLSYDPELAGQIEDFSKVDIKTGDAIGDRLKKAEIYSIGDETNEKRVLFYRNSSVPVWQRDDAPAIRVIRNPLSIVKSAYFSHKKTHSTLGWTRLETQRGILNDVSRDEGMWKTYEFMREDMFFHMTEGPLKTLLSWPDDLLGLETVRMEDMTTAPSSFLLMLWRMLGGEMESLHFVPPEILTFEHQSGGRKPGEVDANNHMRSGDPEEWRDLLPKDLIKQIRKDYAEVLETYYPSSLSDKKTQIAVHIPPKETLRELEAAYTALMESRKETATAQAAYENAEGRLQTVLGQRDKAVGSLNARLDDLKAQRDEARESLKSAKQSAGKEKVDQKQLTALRQERDSVKAALEELKASKSTASGFTAQVQSLTAERDALLEQQSTLTRLKDEAVGAYKTMMQFRDDALDAAKAKNAQALIEAQNRFESMKAQRDKILSEFEARLKDMTSQRDKAVTAQAAMKDARDTLLKESQARFDDMTAQRDKALEAVKGKVSNVAYKKLEQQLAGMKSQRDKAMEAQAAMKESRDKLLGDAEARFEDMKVQRDKALKTAQDNESAKAYEKLKSQLADMTAQRDAALKAEDKASSENHEKLKARLEDMKDQRDKALKNQADMKAQRDKLLAKVNTSA